MKKIIFFVLILISFKGFSQSTVLLRGDTIKVYKQGGTATLRVDSIIMLTKYRAASSTDSILRWDPVSKTVKMSDASGISSVNIYNSDGRLTGNRVLGGAGYNLQIGDSIPSLSIFAGNDFVSTGVGSSIQMSDSVMTLQGTSTTDFTSIVFSPTRMKFTAADGSGSAGDVWTNTGSGYGHWATGGGSGTINSGTTGKPAYYVGATTLDDFAAVDYATSGTNVLITTQNTTDVGLEIKGQSSQTANILNISSSSGTGDIFKTLGNGNTSIDNGTLLVDATNNRVGIGEASPQTNLQVGEDGGVVSTFGTAGQIFFSNNGSATYISGKTGTSEIFFGTTSTSGQYGMLSNHPLEIRTNNTNRFTITAAGEPQFTQQIRMPELATPTTPASGFALVYPKTDGLWYGKDDAGVETKLSNGSFQKGAFLESPTSADTLDMWQTPVAITITSLKAVLRGSSPSVTYNIGFGTSIQSPTAVFTADITCTSITTGCSNSSGFNDATIPAGSFIWIYTNAASGTIRSISFTLNYTED